MRAALHWHIHRPTTLIALVLLPVLLVLGNWQLQRAEEKRSAQAALEQRSHEPPVALRDLPAQPPLYRRVAVRGRFDNARTLLLDNRIHNGRFGYEVIAPFAVDNDDRVLLIDRGWVPGDPARLQRPSIAPLEGEVAVVGSVYRDTGRFGVATALDEKGWPRVIQNLHIDALQTVLGQPLHPFVLRLEADAPGAFIVDWRIYNAGFGPERHVAYAVTWFAMAATLAVAWLLLSSNAWQLIKGKKDDDY